MILGMDRISNFRMEIEIYLKDFFLNFFPGNQFCKCLYFQKDATRLSFFTGTGTTKFMKVKVSNVVTMYDSIIVSRTWLVIVERFIGDFLLEWVHKVQFRKVLCSLFNF